MRFQFQKYVAALALAGTFLSGSLHADEAAEKGRAIL